MNQVDHDEDSVELSCRVGDLQITVRGPLDQATAFVRDCTRRAAAAPSRRAASSEASFDLVSEVGGARTTFETRAQIEASFAPCPAILVAQGDKLSGASLAGPDRVKRAWLAGQWGRAVLDGRAPSPNRTPQLGVRARVYVVLKAEGLVRPAIYKTAKSYWAVVGELETSSSVSHAFPSEQEARVYLQGAGVEDFDVRQ